MIERLPRKLAAAGAPMRMSQPAKGTLKAGGLDVKAEVNGNVTRVTFPPRSPPTKRLFAVTDRSSAIRLGPKAAGRAGCGAHRADEGRSDQETSDHPERLVQRLDWAKFTIDRRFSRVRITDIKNIAEGKRQYEISMLLPRSICGIAREDIADASQGLLGKNQQVRTKPVRVDA